MSEELEACDHFPLEVVPLGMNQMQPCLHLDLDLK